MAFSILLVEDNDGDAELIAEALEAWKRPVKLTRARDGVEALEHTRRDERWSLVLLDLEMPRIDGFQVLTALKSDPRLRAIPVVILTSSAAPADVGAAYDRHANGYFTKPMDFDGYESLLALLEAYWDGGAAPREA